MSWRQQSFLLPGFLNDAVSSIHLSPTSPSLSHHLILSCDREKKLLLCFEPLLVLAYLLWKRDRRRDWGERKIEVREKLKRVISGGELRVDLPPNDKSIVNFYWPSLFSPFQGKPSVKGFLIRQISIFKVIPLVHGILKVHSMSLSPRFIPPSVFIFFSHVFSCVF
jgi:hypothetical protein